MHLLLGVHSVRLHSLLNSLLRGRLLGLPRNRLLALLHIYEDREVHGAAHFQGFAKVTVAVVAA